MILLYYEKGRTNPGNFSGKVWFATSPALPTQLLASRLSQKRKQNTYKPVEMPQLLNDSALHHTLHFLPWGKCGKFTQLSVNFPYFPHTKLLFGIFYRWRPSWLQQNLAVIDTHCFGITQKPKQKPFFFKRPDHWKTVHFNVTDTFYCKLMVWTLNPTVTMNSNVNLLFGYVTMESNVNLL